MVERRPTMPQQMLRRTWCNRKMKRMRIHREVYAKLYGFVHGSYVVQRSD